MMAEDNADLAEDLFESYVNQLCLWKNCQEEPSIS